MIRLTATTRSLQLVLAGAITTNQIPASVSYSDKTTTTYDGGMQLANSNSATPVTICAAPSASTVRDIDYISVHNTDTAAATITVLYNDNATTYKIFTATLAIGDQAVYVHGSGWQVVTSAGEIKTSVSGSAGTGTVTSVAVSGGGTGLTTTGGPITTAGTITLTGILELDNGGTGSNLSDPNADRIMFWDDSGSAVDWLTAGAGLSISGTTITATGTPLKILYNNENLTIDTNTQVTGHKNLTFTGTGVLIVNGTGSLAIL